MVALGVVRGCDEVMRHGFGHVLVNHFMGRVEYVLPVGDEIISKTWGTNMGKLVHIKTSLQVYVWKYRKSSLVQRLLFLGVGFFRSKISLKKKCHWTLKSPLC